MMKTPIKKIVIVGGGSAGWMSAALLSKKFPNIKFELVESPDVPTVGVGESTLGTLNLFLHLLDLNDEDWMPHCNATHKLAIKFTDFYKKGESFYYPFGLKDKKNTTDGIRDWYHKKLLYPDTPWNDFYDCMYSNMPLIYNNKICDNTSHKLEGYSFKNDVAYHMDAALFGEFLRDQMCIPAGVTHTKQHIESIVKEEDGYIDYLLLKNGEKVKGDLYIDCTGFRSLLLEQTMGVPFESFNNLLPNDRAWTCHVPYHDKELEMENVTNCTAYNNGWVWNIPLYHRIGSGYVFSSKFISEEDALQEYKDYLNSDKMTYHDPNRTDNLEFRLVKIKNGTHDKCWEKNVVGVGLSYAFIEPLESTGLFSVQEMLVLLFQTLDNEQVNRMHVDWFNYMANVTMQSFKTFVTCHYTLSSRRDTPYWQHVTENIELDYRMIDKELSELHTIASDIAGKMLRSHELGTGDGGFPDIFVGNHMLPVNRMSLEKIKYDGLYIGTARTVPAIFNTATENYWRQKKAKNEHVVNKCPSHYQYLKTKHYKDKE
jgi:flavin-dependent dehydrogenase